MRDAVPCDSSVLCDSVLDDGLKDAYYTIVLDDTHQTMRIKR